jgi:hypothetical protein
MGLFLNGFIFSHIKKFFTNTFSLIHAINTKYATPQLKTSKAVKFSLLCLRLYLILLVGLLFFKFYTALTAK